MKTYAVKFNFLFVSMFQGVILMGVYSSWILSQKLSIDKSGDLNDNSELIKALEDKSRFLVSTTASDWFYEAINRLVLGLNFIKFYSDLMHIRTKGD